MVKTEAQLADAWQRQRAAIAAREARYLQRRRRMTVSLTTAGAVIGLVGFALLGFAWSGSWLALAPGLIAGAAGGYAIGKLGIGMLLGALALGPPLLAAYLLCLAVGWLQLGVGSMAGGIGQLLILICTIASWPLLGCTLGWVNQLFDDDHIVI